MKKKDCNTLKDCVQRHQGIIHICILRSCSVSDLCVTVIGDQMVLRRPVFAPPDVTLQVVNVVLSEMNSVCNIHSRV